MRNENMERPENFEGQKEPVPDKMDKTNPPDKL